MPQLTWEGPFRSPGSTQAHRRLIFRLYAAKSEGAELAQHVLTAALRKEPLLRHAIIGREQTVNEPGAQVLEVATLEASPAFRDLLGDEVVICASELLLRTAASLADW